MLQTVLKQGAYIILDSLDCPPLGGGGRGGAVEAGKRDPANRVVNPSRLAPERLFLSSFQKSFFFSLSHSLSISLAPFLFSFFSPQFVNYLTNYRKLQWRVAVSMEGASTSALKMGVRLVV